MKPISDKLHAYTARYSFVKRRKSPNPHLVTKDIQAVPGRSPVGVKNI